MKRKLMFTFTTLLLVLSVISSSTAFALSSEQSNHYSENVNGETYGYAIQAETIGYEPDLIAATGTNGTDGYVRKTDLDGPTPSSPEEAIAMQPTNGRYIPLYESDGETVIGEFYVSPPTTNISIMSNGTSATGNINTIDVYGRLFYSQNTGHGSENRAYATTKIWTNSTIPGGHMAAKARIYGANDNKLKAESDWCYNSDDSSSITAYTSHWTLFGKYYSKGSTREWVNSQTTWQHATYPTGTFEV